MSLSASVYAFTTGSVEENRQPESVLYEDQAKNYLQSQGTSREVASMYLGNTMTCINRREQFRQVLGVASLLESALYQAGTVIPSSVAPKLSTEAQLILQKHKAAFHAAPDNNNLMQDFIFWEGFKAAVDRLVEASVRSKSPIVVE